MPELRQIALRAFICVEPAAKQARVAEMAAWRARAGLSLDAASRLIVPLQPGAPAAPRLVAPQFVPKRKLGSITGRGALIHALAHIEFNAINLALDAIARFADMPADYYDDWLRVAHEESQHYGLLSAYLETMGYRYGDFTAHNGLWEMALKTADDLLARMALVPRMLEARGLDVTPGIQARLRRAGDAEAVRILDIILRDEVGHVQIGNRWYHGLCAQRGLDPDAAFEALCREFSVAPPRPPFNDAARLAAGFTAQQLQRWSEQHAD